MKKLKLFSLLLLLLLGAEQMWGASPASLSWTSSIEQNSAASSDDFDVFTATYAKQGSETAPVYWNKNNVYGIKMYSAKSGTGNKITISTSQANTYITNIAITGSTAQGTCSLYWDGNTSTTGTSHSYTEESKTTSAVVALKETGGNKAGQYIVTNITVTYIVSQGGQQQTTV